MPASHHRLPSVHLVLPALRGPGTGWDLHEYRHSALTHLGEQGASLLMLMAKSRHKKPENVRFCPPLPANEREVISCDEPSTTRDRPPSA
jgi:hypothetical protein